MSDTPINVLFLSKRNSARSIIAESLLQRHGFDRFKGYSAGIEKENEIHPYAIELLKTMNHSVDFDGTKTLDQLQEQEFDFVFPVSDDVDVSAYTFKGNPFIADWFVPDPLACEGTDTEKHLAFSDAYRMLNNRISIFVNLPLNANEKDKLQQRLNDIGK